MIRLGHVAIATRRIDDVIRIYTEILGLDLTEWHNVEQEKIRVAVIKAGETAIELMEPTSPDSTVHKFIEKRGEGIHHIAFKTSEFDKLINNVRQSDVKLVFGENRTSPRGYRYNFIHPRSTGGVLIEITD